MVSAFIPDFYIVYEQRIDFVMLKEDTIRDNPLISILVPVYNVEAYIRKSLDSILAQTYVNLQIILIDDGSTDSSGDICNKYALMDKRITVIHKENGGVTSARIEGLKIARGEFIGFVDPDDWIEPSMYKEMLEYAIKTDAEIVHTDKIKEVKGMYYSIKEDNLPAIINPSTDVEFLKSVVAGHFTVVLWLNLFKSELIQSCYESFPRHFRNGEDYVIVFLSMIRANRMAYLSKGFYHYVKRDGSIQHNADISLMFTTAMQFQVINDIIENNPYKSLLKPHIDRCFIRRMIFVINKTNIINHIPIYMPSSLDDLYGKDIVLCGAGTIGYDYYVYLSQCHVCNIVSWVDAFPDNYNYTEQVYSIKEILNCKYDIVLIAVEKKDLAEQIMDSLLKLGVEKEKIYWKSPASIIDTR